MILLIGSRALSNHIEIERTSMDIDVVGTYDDVMAEYGRNPIKYPIDNGKKYLFMDKPNSSIIEAELAWEGSTAEEMMKLAIDDPDSEECFNFIMPGLDFLYMLKMSHRYLKNSPHFLKTMRDIQLMRKHGAVIRTAHKGFYKRRMKETYWYTHPSLKKAQKDAFFTDNVKYIYDHDDIHKAVAIGPVPAYLHYMKDGAEVDCDKEKFFTVDEEIRLNGVAEEAYVLALERNQIPFNFKDDPYEVWKFALMKVCTSITSGWFREYAWEHYDEVISRYNEKYVEDLQIALVDGRIKPYRG